MQKLDRSTRYAWETSLADSKAVPNFQALSDFLENRVYALESTTNHSDSILSAKSQTPGNQNTQNSNTRGHTAGKTVSNATTNADFESQFDENANNKSRSKTMLQFSPCVLCSSDHKLTSY